MKTTIKPSLFVLAGLCIALGGILLFFVQPKSGLDSGRKPGPPPQSGASATTNVAIDDPQNYNNNRNRPNENRQTPLIEHYISQLTERKIPWNEIDGFLEMIEKKIPQESFFALMEKIGEADCYNNKEKAELFNKFVSPDAGGNSYYAVDNYLRGVSLASEREFAEALNPSITRESLFSTYYSVYCSSLPILMDVIMSDIPKDNPGLGGDIYTVAGTLASVAQTMTVKKIATREEIIHSIEKTKIDGEFQKLIISEINKYPAIND